MGASVKCYTVVMLSVSQTTRILTLVPRLWQSTSGEWVEIAKPNLDGHLEHLN